MDSGPEMEYFSFLEVPPVGRDHELRVLQWLFQKARSGQGRLVLVSGEAGIGKTTLVEQFTRQASESATVIAGGCIDLAAPSPYAPWKEAFARLPSEDAARLLDVPASAGIVDQTTRVREIQRCLAVEASEQPLVLILEDIHWADTESLSLLRHLARTVRTMPLLIVTTYREDELSPGDPLYDVLLPLVRESAAERIPLRRLTVADIASMVETRFHLDEADGERLIDELERRSEGNPFFIVELLRAMEHTGVLSNIDGRWHFDGSHDLEIPVLIRQLIERRMQELSPASRQMLQFAAVLGFEARPDLLAFLMEREQPDLAAPVREALDAGLIEQSSRGDQLRFRHALVQEALYASTTIPWRQDQHRRIAELLAEIPGTDPSNVADHFRRAGDHRARMWMLQAARRARQIFAPFTVVQHLNHVLEEPLMLDPSERMEAYRLRGWAHMITGEFESANRDFLAEADSARAVGEHRAEWGALIRLAELWTGRDYQRVGEYVEQTLRVTREMNDHALMARSHTQFGTWCISQDEPGDAREHHESALRICQAAGDEPGIADAHNLLALTLALSGSMDEAADHFRQAVSLAGTGADRQIISAIRANRAHLGPNYLTDMVVVAAGLEDCIREGLEARDIAREIGYRVGEAYAEVRLGYSFGAHGSYQNAIESVERSITGSEEIGNRQMMSAAHALAGQLWIDLLDPRRARTHAIEAGDISARIDSTFRIRMAAAVSATAHIAEEDYDAADRELRAVWPGSTAPQTLAQCLLWRARIELEIARGEPEAAMLLIDAALNATPNACRNRPALRLSYLRGQALNALHRYDHAEQWLVPARDLAVQLGARSLLWRIHLELGTARQGHGDRIGASAAFSDARQLVSEISTSLTDPDERSRYYAAALALVPEPRLPTSLQAAKQASGGLTRRQREVATLIAEGNTNREIADLLSISERTIESHVTAILSTLGLNSRTQIAAWSVEQGIREEQQDQQPLCST